MERIPRWVSPALLTVGFIWQAIAHLIYNFFGGSGQGMVMVACSGIAMMLLGIWVKLLRMDKS